jgi:hypothetical protein
MLKIIKARGKGKTGKLIELSAKNWAYIACRSFDAAHEIATRAREKGLDIPFPITYGELLTASRDSSYKVLIDNVEDYIAYTIQQKSSIKIVAITMNLDSTDIEYPQP